MVEWFVGISMAVLYVFQTALADKIQIFGAAPDFVFTVVICYSILAGREKGVIAALFAGLFVDLLAVGSLGMANAAQRDVIDTLFFHLLSGNGFGRNLLMYTYTAALASMLGNSFFGKSGLTAAFITLVLTMLSGILTALLMYLTKLDRNILYNIFAVTLPGSIIGSIFSAVYYAVLDNVSGRTYR